MVWYIAPFSSISHQRQDRTLVCHRLRPPSQRRPAAQNPASQEQSMRKQNRDDDPAVHSFPPPPNTRKHSLHANKNLLFCHGTTSRRKGSTHSQTLTHAPAVLLVDWLHPPRNSCRHNRLTSVLLYQQRPSSIPRRRNPHLMPRKSHKTRPTKPSTP